MNRLFLDQYGFIEENFFNGLNNDLKDNLLFYAITGSMSRNDVIPGWSDIDVLIIVKEYNTKIVSIINRAFSKNSSGIKIGLTLFSYNGFLNREIYKDPKTLYSIDLIKQGLCKPKIFDKKIEDNINQIHELSSWYDKASLAGVVHGYKRALLPISNYDEKIVYKKLNTILKIILKQKGISAHGYNEVISLSKNELKEFNFNFNTPSFIMENIDTSLERYDEYIRFLRWLENCPKF